MSSNTYHKSKTCEYRTWRSMRSRCSTPSVPSFPVYGGRGIKVDPRWQNFENFLEDMGPRPLGHSIDRIDPDGDYTKENCRWATQTMQQNNRRNNRKFLFDGSMLTISEIARRTGIDKKTLRYRLVLRRLSLAEAIGPQRPWFRRFTLGGAEMTASQIAKASGIPYTTLISRLNKGMTIYEAVNGQKEAS